MVQAITSSVNVQVSMVSMLIEPLGPTSYEGSTLLPYTGLSVRKPADDRYSKVQHTILDILVTSYRLCNNKE